MAERVGVAEAHNPEGRAISRRLAEVDRGRASSSDRNVSPVRGRIALKWRMGNPPHLPPKMGQETALCCHLLA
jgi:hypothetical protein